jgi:hypothetical protein
MRKVHMSAQVILGKAVYTIHGADHLRVDGELVQIQRAGPNGFETVAVAGEDMLVTIEAAEFGTVEKAEKGGTDGYHWLPADAPLD